MNNTLHTILALYGLPATSGIQPFGSGLINHTWLVNNGGARYILQQVNHQIFKNPADIAYNIRLLAGWLQQHQPGYLFVTPLTTTGGDDLVNLPGEGYFRLFPFITGSHTINVVNTPGQAYEAARQFGGFTRRLAAFPASNLRTTLPAFHDLPLRYQQFQQALLTGNPERIAESAALVQYLQQQRSILHTAQAIAANPAFKTRVTHHDTKISNVLFNSQDKGLCVIDLDTVMPGHFISDVGDMMRTYLSPVDEEETDLERVEIRTDFLQAIEEGYMEEMTGELAEEEKRHFLYAGQYMTYMQALRFLTDHLNNDVYYGARYEGHNLNRAANQARLLQCLVK